MSTITTACRFAGIPDFTDDDAECMGISLIDQVSH
jgi:hypothetical protein